VRRVALADFLDAWPVAAGYAELQARVLNAVVADLSGSAEIVDDDGQALAVVYYRAGHFDFERPRVALAELARPLARSGELTDGHEAAAALAVELACADGREGERARIRARVDAGVWSLLDAESEEETDDGN
jgi:hypothetical protein